MFERPLLQGSIVLCKNGHDVLFQQRRSLHIFWKVLVFYEATKQKLRVTRSSKGMYRNCGAYGPIWTTQPGNEQILTDSVLWSLSSFLSACKGVGSSFSAPGEAANASPNLDRRLNSVSAQVRRSSEQLLSGLLRCSQRGPKSREQHLVPSH